LPSTTGRRTPTWSIHWPARTDISIGMKANTATSAPTMKVDRPNCSAVRDTVIRPPVSAMWFSIATTHNMPAAGNSVAEEGGEGEDEVADTALTTAILCLTCSSVEPPVFAARSCPGRVRIADWRRFIRKCANLRARMRMLRERSGIKHVASIIDMSPFRNEAGASLRRAHGKIPGMTAHAPPATSFTASDSACEVDAERRFGGLARLYGPEATARLRAAPVAEAGKWAVCALAAEAHIRCGWCALP